MRRDGVRGSGALPRLQVWMICGGLLALAAALCGCAPQVQAPIDAGYCWRMNVDAQGRSSFHPINTGVHNLETCAANLEAVALREHQPRVTGAFQGQFIFVTPDMIQSSMRLKGVRYRLFDAETRGKIDHDLKWMLDDEKHPSKFGPQAPPPR